ncbi:hypothetical protein M413DRAFT_396835 [Hebeloma cylindrosporum]|uniref:Uncharacterized protein n=1 Tax=Hebeloma cylindrosporum TaxID=76867 RepID=A0A0C3C2M3_HEBCY|nr:hypothetical protein M413DRAFT_396835 [Hebeloma cylindrosporum h7]
MLTQLPFMIIPLSHYFYIGLSRHSQPVKSIVSGDLVTLRLLLFIIILLSSVTPLILPLDQFSASACSSVNLAFLDLSNLPNRPLHNIPTQFLDPPRTSICLPG